MDMRDTFACAFVSGRAHVVNLKGEWKYSSARVDSCAREHSSARVDSCAQTRCGCLRFAPSPQTRFQ